MPTLRTAVLTASVLSLAAIRPASGGESQTLAALSQSVETLVQRVSPGVVQIVVDGSVTAGDRATTDAGLPLGRQRSIGSGVIVSADGYIVTNAHVLAGAKSIRVLLSPSSPAVSPLRSGGLARGRSLDAHLVGQSDEVDLAVLKIDASGLLALPLANYDAVRQGQLVFAFGSPEGLQNSVSMGVVSAVARQPDADKPLVYIQTDAPINRGNSGGPLVNANGEVVGINTFILSESGGSQGLGFAIPSAIVAVAYPQLRDHGHLHRASIGINIQPITSELATALTLPDSGGLLVADIDDDAPAASAGLRIQDVIDSVDGKPISSVPEFGLAMYTHAPGDLVHLHVLRGRSVLDLGVPLTERRDDLDAFLDGDDVERNRVPRLGILGRDLDAAVQALLPALRLRYGVLVMGCDERLHAGDDGVAPGDVIHAVNGIAVASVRDLQALVDHLDPHAPVALQIERSGRLRFAAVPLD